MIWMKKQNSLSNFWFSFMLPVKWLLKRQRKLRWVFSQEWDLQLCYLNSKDVGECLAWIQRERRRMLNTSGHCSQFENMLMRGIEKACFSTVAERDELTRLWLIIVSEICHTCNKCANKYTVEDLPSYCIAVWT